MAMTKTGKKSGHQKIWFLAFLSPLILLTTLPLKIYKVRLKEAAAWHMAQDLDLTFFLINFLTSLGKY